MTLALPRPIRQRATSPSFAHRCSCGPVGAQAAPPRPRRPPSRSPQWPSSPVSAKSGGGRRRSPSMRLLSHLSTGSASSTTLPAAAHPRVELDQHLGRLRARVRHQQQSNDLSGWPHRRSRSGRRDSALDPRRSPATLGASSAKLFAEQQGQAGQQAPARGRAVGADVRGWRRDAATSARQRSRATSASAISQWPRHGAGAALACPVLAASTAPARRRSAPAAPRARRHWRGRWR